MSGLRSTSATMPPNYSSRMYLQLAPDGISLLKFLLEAEDNLAYLSTVSPHSAVVKLVYAPGQEREVREFLETAHHQVTFHAVAIFRGVDGLRET
ncbi:MAG: DUF4911 domain-containing protein [Desulfovibrionales bacterium]|nr:MAG: DUF4911 domain-containing protein [Desulfovibrionales bacterium]